MEYLEKVLRECELWEQLPSPPLFVSAATAWTEANDGAEPQSLRELETLVWQHLLRTRSTGVDRLAGLLSQLDNATSEFMTLAAVGRATAAQITELQKGIAASQMRRDAIIRECRDTIPKLRRAAWKTVSDRRDFVCTSLRSSLQAIPLDKPLPTIDALKPQIIERLNADMTACWQEIHAQLKGFAVYVSGEVESSLKQARMTPGIPNVRLVIPDIAIPDDFGPDAFAETLFGAVFLGVLGLAFSPAIALMGLFLGGVVGAETSKGERRKRDIDSRIKFFEPKIATAFDGFWTEVNDRTQLFSKNLLQHVYDRMNIYFHDVDRQIATLGSAASIDPTVDRELQKSRIALARLVREVSVP
jgi:hypothetical protein